MNIEMKTDVGEEQGHGKNNGRTLLRVNVVEKNFDRSSNSSYPSDYSLSRVIVKLIFYHREQDL